MQYEQKSTNATYFSLTCKYEVLLDYYAMYCNEYNVLFRVTVDVEEILDNRCLIPSILFYTTVVRSINSLNKFLRKLVCSVTIVTLGYLMKNIFNSFLDSLISMIILLFKNIKSWGHYIKLD